jgi:hypothetical protein
MKSVQLLKASVLVAAISVAAGCSSWQRMDKEEGTAAGGVGGAVAGAVVGGPVGAVVGGAGGAIVGHETTGKGASGSNRVATADTPDSNTIRSAQQALNARGYHAGAEDGQLGPSTQDAIRRFQQASGLPQTGYLGHETLQALGISG